MRHWSRRSFLKLGALAGAAGLAAGCQGKQTVPEAPTVNLFNWEAYLDPANKDLFQTDSEIVLTERIFNSNEELIQSLQEDTLGLYDVVVPSDYAVRELIGLKLLQPLDLDRLPSLNNLQAPFLKAAQADPRHVYGIPKHWGTTGILWRRDLVERAPGSWAEFWELAAQFDGRVVVVDDRDEVIGAALKLTGHSLNDSDPGHLAQAEAALFELRPHVTLLTDYFEPLTRASVVMALGWNGDALQLQETYGAPVSYAVPAEGSARWEDRLCLTANALHPLSAHRFIDFLLDPAVAAAECAYTGYATPVAPALDLLAPEIRANPIIFPPAEVLDRLELLGEFDSQTVALRDEIWARFVAG